jgi:hypothetical protein
MSIDRTSFESLYNGQPRWEIGRPQKALLDVADDITGAISISSTIPRQSWFRSKNSRPLDVEVGSWLSFRKEDA